MCKCTCAPFRRFTLSNCIMTNPLTFPKHPITHKSCIYYLPVHCTFKSSPWAFIDSNLRIVLEFWHLLILNLLTPGGPDLNITLGVYLNTYKESIPKTPWIAAIHAHWRDSKQKVFSLDAAWLIKIPASKRRVMYLGESFDIGDFLSMSTGTRGRFYYYVYFYLDSEADELPCKHLMNSNWWLHVQAFTQSSS